MRFRQYLIAYKNTTPSQKYIINHEIYGQIKAKLNTSKWKRLNFYLMYFIQRKSKP